LTVLHIGDGKENDWDSFPSFREALRRWGLLAKEAERAYVAKLGLRIKKRFFVEIRGAMSRS
jgi:hypothetical protein